jgi:hypothetical protein
VESVDALGGVTFEIAFVMPVRTELELEAEGREEVSATAL